VQQEGFECHVLYANLLAAKFVKPELYKEFTRKLSFLGEWLFSEAVFGSFVPQGVADPDFISYYNARKMCIDGYADPRTPQIHYQSTAITNPHPFLQEILGEDFRNVINELKNDLIPAYISHLRKVFDRYQKAKIVGFTTTFNQTIPSIALARIAKQQLPETMIVFGGANCQQPMGPALMRAFPVIDYVVSGEGEEAFPSLVKALLSGNNQKIIGLGGISYRDETGVKTNPVAPPIGNLDAYPIMDCDDYYLQWEELDGLRIERGPLYFECSRGCWWGQHSHCTFCGFNGPNMSYRSKSPDRIIKELVELSKRHKILSFQAVDNILNPAHFITLLPKLRETGFDFNLFFEVKASMTKKHARILAEAGVTEAQAGIESLSTHVLQLMKKGTTMLENIQLMKWFEDFDIHCDWSPIGGFPGETEEDYSLMERVIPLLYHLAPPRTPALTRIEMNRFSPNFDFAEEFGFKNIMPKQDYNYVYDVGDDLLRDIAYSFDYELPGFDKFVPHIQRINALLEEWTRKYYDEFVELKLQKGPDFLEIIDERSGSRKDIVLEGYEMQTLLSCDRVCSFDQILNALRSRDKCVSESDVTASIQALDRNRLILSEDDKYLSLPTERSPLWNSRTITSARRHLVA